MKMLIFAVGPNQISTYTSPFHFLNHSSPLMNDYFKSLFKFQLHIKSDLSCLAYQVFYSGYLLAFQRGVPSGISQNRSDCSWFDVSSSSQQKSTCLAMSARNTRRSFYFPTPLFAPPNSYFTQSVQMAFACGTVFRPRVHSSAEGESGHDRSICVFRLNPMNWLLVELPVD